MKYVRQSAATDISTSRRGQQHELRSAELMKERRPTGRFVLMKKGVSRREEEERVVVERSERGCACTLDRSRPRYPTAAS